jgi:hypothetical protein
VNRRKRHMNRIDRSLARKRGLGNKTSGQRFGLVKTGKHRNGIEKIKPSACSAAVRLRVDFDSVRWALYANADFTARQVKRRDRMASTRRHVFLATAEFGTSSRGSLTDGQGCACTWAPHQGSTTTSVATTQSPQPSPRSATPR